LNINILTLEDSDEVDNKITSTQNKAFDNVKVCKDNIKLIYEQENSSCKQLSDNLNKNSNKYQDSYQLSEEEDEYDNDFESEYQDDKFES